MSEEVKNRHIKEILGVIRSGKSDAYIRDRLEDFHEKDVSEALPMLTRTEWVRLQGILDTPRVAEILEYADEDAEDLLEALPDERAAEILTEMESDDAVDFLKNTDSEKKESWLSHMPPEDRSTLENLASYDEDTIGSRMTTNFITVRLSMSIQEAMKELISQSADHDNISTIYVTHTDGTYAGAIDLKDLIIARKDTPLMDIVVPAYPAVYADDKISDAVPLMEEYAEESIPVLSKAKKILGVVTANDLAEVIDAEMSDDYAKLGGLSGEDDLDEPIHVSVKKRLPWLILLLVLGLIVSSVVGMYEQVVAKLTIIMAFQSMILDMSGNVGTQSLAVTIRVLMDQNVTGRDKLKLLRHEASAGFLNGAILGAISIVGVGIYIALAKGMPVQTAFAISICIGLSLLIAMMISSLVGTVIPMFFKKIGVDPAVASGPLITTITDLVGVITYYSMAWFMLINILGM